MTPIKDDNDNGDEWPGPPPAPGEATDDSGDWIGLPPSFDDAGQSADEPGDTRHSSSEYGADEYGADEPGDTDQWHRSATALAPGTPADGEGAEPAVAAAAPPPRHEPAPALPEPRAMRWWPVSLALLTVAVIGSLTFGAYVLIRESEALRAEIQFLQVQLETAVLPADALAARELRRSLMQRNESLENELESLQLQYARQQAELAEALASSTADKAALEEALLAARQPQPPVPVQTEAQKDVANTSDGSGDWFVNFGSYGQRAIAQRWTERLDVAGRKVVLQEAVADGEPVYRVRIIGLETKSSADKLARALQSQYNLPALWVGRD